MLTQKRVQEIFSYNKRTGLLRRRIYVGGRGFKGVVGTPDGSKGYLRVVVDGRNYTVTHIIWLYMTGRFPKKQIDHKNTNKTDNRWNNLREATNSQNKCNSPPRCDNKTGVKGVTIDDRTGRFRASISANSKRVHLGFFGSVEEAKIARLTAAKKLHGAFIRE